MCFLIPFFPPPHPSAPSLPVCFLPSSTLPPSSLLIILPFLSSSSLPNYTFSINSSFPALISSSSPFPLVLHPLFLPLHLFIYLLILYPAPILFSLLLHFLSPFIYLLIPLPLLLSFSLLFPFSSVFSP